MSTTQTKNPSTCVNLATVGTAAWANPSRATTSNNSWAKVSLGSTQISNYLKCTGYGFSWPAGSVPVSIKAMVERHASVAGRATDYRIRLVKDNVIQAEDKATLSTYPTSDGVATYTFATAGWMASDFNNGNFGVAIACRNSASGPLSGVDVSIDTVSMEIECETTQNIVLPKLTGMLNLIPPTMRRTGDIYLPKLTGMLNLHSPSFTTFIVIPPKLPFLRLRSIRVVKDQVIRLPKLTGMLNLRKLRFPTSWTPESTPTPTTWSDT